MHLTLTEAQYDGLATLARGFCPATNTIRALQRRNLVTEHLALTINGWREHARYTTQDDEPLSPDAREWDWQGTISGDFRAAARMARYSIAGHNRSMRRTQRINAIETSHTLPL